MHKNIYVACMVLALLGLSCSFVSPSTPAPVDQTSVTAEPGDAITQSPDGIIPQPTQSARIIFSDDFSSPTSGWTRTNQDGHLLSYSEGSYLTIAPMHERGWVNVGMSPTKFTDAVLSVDFHIVSGDSNDTSAIVAWRVQDWKNYYALFLSDNGFINVSRLENGQLVPVYDWTEEPAINTDYQVNHVDIVFVQETSTIYLNKTLITSFKDAKYKMGQVGLGGFSATDSSIEVRYDNLVIYDSNEWELPVP
jgi:hypothetical protein